MANTRSLERELGKNLAWNSARINFIAKFIIALIQVRTVNCIEIASVMSGRAKAASNYKRIQRFFRFFDISYPAIAILLVKLIGQSAPWVVILDRTNWEFGEKKINILTLAIAYEGIAIPIFWKLLEKKGNSNTAERIALLEEFIDLFGVKAIKYLCGDREFIGKQWFKYLKKMGIDFRLRIRENQLLPNTRGIMRKAWRLFGSQAIETPLILENARKVWGIELYFSGMRLKTGEYLIILAPRYSPSPMQDYARRWEIETLFGCLKTRGFRLEETHFIDSERLQKLIALLAIAFCWAHIVGNWLASQTKLEIKKHGRKAKSIFRLGFDFLRRIFCNFNLIDFNRVVSFLSCT